MDINPSQIRDLFKQATSRIAIATSNGGNAGEIIGFRANGQRCQGRCAQKIVRGQCLALQENNGNWWLVNTQPTEDNSQNQRFLAYKKQVPSPIRTVYPVSCLLLATLPPQGEGATFWLTGTTRLTQQSQVALALDNLAAVRGLDGFVQNRGITNSYHISGFIQTPIPYQGAANRNYAPTLIIVPPNTITTDFYFFNERENNRHNLSFFYLGDGIWQTPIENGMGAMIDGVGFNQIFAGATMYLDGGIPNGISYFTFEPARQNTRLDANILPENVNQVVHNGILEEKNGAIAVDLTGYDSLDTSDILLPLRNKNIQHTTWTPDGDTIFTYTAQLTGNASEYVYTEDISGELLAIAWNEKYIIHQFTATKTSTFTNTGGSNYSLTEKVSKTQSLTLKSYDSEESLILDSGGKFLRVLATPSLSLGQESFSVQVQDVAGVPPSYYEINPDFDPSDYIEEAFITSVAIENNPYLVRGQIVDIGYIPATKTTNIDFNIASLQLLPKTVIRGGFYDISFNHPFNGIIVLDNGCFWNYWLSQNLPNFSRYQRHPNYPFFSFREPGSLWTFKYGLVFDQRRFSLICDQTLEFVHTNPVSQYCMDYSGYLHYFPSHELLFTDNLVNNKIYRVVELNYLQGDLPFSYENLSLIKKIPIAEWEIGNDGEVFFKRVFLVDFNALYPYYEGSPRELQSDRLLPINYTYHPNQR